MKSTWPMPAARFGHPTPPIFHLLALVVGVGGNTNFSFRVEGNANLRFLDTNMLVSRNCGVGGLSQREDPMRLVLCCSGL